MSIVVDSSYASCTTTSTAGYLTGLQKGTVLKTSTPLISTTAAAETGSASGASYYFIYSSDENANQEYGAGVTTDSASFVQSTSSALASLEEYNVSGSDSIISTTAVSTTASSSGSSLARYSGSNKKLTCLVGTMIGLSLVITSL